MKKLFKHIFFILCYFCFPVFLFSNFEISESGEDDIIFFRIFPNTDHQKEYIELYNRGEKELQLKNYQLFGTSGKTYVFPQIHLPAKHILKLLSEDTGIVLNDSDEFLTLVDAQGTIVQKIFYKTSKKNQILTFADFDLSFFSGGGLMYYSAAKNILFSEKKYEIEFKLQQPSTGYFDKNGDFICENTGKICSINLDIRENNAKNCEIFLKKENILIDQIHSCNPSTIKLESGMYTMQIFAGFEDGSKKEKIFFVENIYKKIDIKDKKIFMKLQKPTNARYDEETKKFVCTEEKCRINFDFSDTQASFCEFLYGGEVFQSKNCNPSTIDFPKGESVFKIHAFYDDKNFLEQKFFIENIYTIPDIGDIIYNFQKPSSVYADVQADVFFCDRQKSSCIINLDLRENSNSSKKVSCETQIGEKIFSGCNPSSIYMGLGETSIKIKIFLQEYPDRKKIKTLKIINLGVYSESEKPMYIKKNFKKGDFVHLKKPVIEIESGLELEKEKNSYVCTKFPCKINIKHTPIHKDIACEWHIGFGKFAGKKITRCNPSSFIFEHPGSYTIGLNIYQKSNHTNRASSDINFSVKSDIVQKIEEEKTQENFEIYFEKFKIHLQGKTGKNLEKTDATITCITKEFCFINLSLSSNAKFLKRGQKINYKWDFGNGDFSHKKNPAAIKYAPGVYQVSVVATFGDQILARDEVSVIVHQIPKTQKAQKKSSKKKEKTAFVGEIELINFLANPAGNDAKEFFEIKNKRGDFTLIENCYMLVGKRKIFFKKAESLKPFETRRFYKLRTKVSLKNTDPELSLWCNDEHINTIKTKGKIAENSISGNPSNISLGRENISRELLEYGTKLKISKLKKSIKITLDTYPGVTGKLYFQGKTRLLDANPRGVIVLKLDREVEVGNFEARFETRIGEEKIEFLGDKSYFITQNDKYNFIKKYLSKKRKKKKKLKKEKNIIIETPKKEFEQEKYTISFLYLVLTSIFFGVFFISGGYYFLQEYDKDTV